MNEASVLFCDLGAHYIDVFSLRKFIELIDALLCMYVIKNLKMSNFFLYKKVMSYTLCDSTNHTNNNENSKNNDNSH